MRRSTSRVGSRAPYGPPLPRTIGTTLGSALQAALVVFAAELGDRSQLVVLTQAGSRRLGATIAGLAAVIAVLQGVAAVAGGLVGNALSDTVVGWVSGLLFLGFAVVTWRAAPDDDEDASPASLARVLVLFFLAELGDKTNLAAATLAARDDPFAVWVGATVGMLAATLLALAAGQWLRRVVGARRLTLVGAVAFAVVGVAVLVSTAT